MLTKKHYINSNNAFAYKEFSKILINLINKNCKKEIITLSKVIYSKRMSLEKYI